MSVALHQARNGRPFERTPAQRRHRGATVSEGRGQVMTHMASVVLAVRARKDEIEQRARTASGDPKNVFGPATRNGLEGGSVHMGMPALCRIGPSATFRQALTSGSSVEGVVNVAGLSRDEKLAMPHIPLTSRDNTNMDAEDLYTGQFQGTNTTWNTSTSTISTGQPVLFDPNANLIEDENGQQSSGMLTKGIPAAVLPIQTRALLTTTIDTTLAHYDEVMRKLLGALQAEGELTKSVAEMEKTKTADAMSVLFRKRVQEEADKHTDLAKDHPVRLHMLVQLAWMYQQFGRLHTKGTKQRLHQRWVAANTLRLCLMVVQQQEEATLAAYERTMPQTYVETEAYDKKNDRLDGIGDLTFKPQSLAELEDAEVHLAAHHQRLVRVLYSLTADYYHRLVGGRSLCNAPPGKPLDIGMGMH